VFGRSNLKVHRAADPGAQVYQLGRLQQALAPIALIATGAFESAMGAGPLNVTVREKTPVVRRVNLRRFALLKQSGGFEFVREVLGQLMVMQA